MAYTYIGKDQGVGIAEVAVGASTTSKAVEISIDSAKIKQGEAWRRSIRSAPTSAPPLGPRLEVDL